MKKTSKRDQPDLLYNRSNILPHRLQKPIGEVENVQSMPAADEQEKIMDFIRQNKTTRISTSSHATVRIEPVFLSEPLIAYKYDPGLAQHEEVIFTVKTTLQLEKNDYQADLMKSQNLGVFGRDAARPYVLGIVAAFPLAYDRFDWTLAEAKWAFSTVEPYGVDASQTKWRWPQRSPFS